MNKLFCHIQHLMRLSHAFAKQTSHLTRFLVHDG
jgi:hypothetical protein